MFIYQPTSPWVKKISKIPFPLGTIFFLLTSKIAREVFNKVYIQKSTDSALQPIYFYNSKNPRYSVWDHRWQSSKAAQSLRFRFEWIQKTLKQLSLTLLDKKSCVQVLSLGSGTGLVFTQLLEELDKKRRGMKILFIDKDERAIKRAEQNVKNKGFENHVEYLLDDSSNALINLSDNSFDLVELVGIAEYVDDDWLKNQNKKVFRVLSSGGYYVGAAISDNEEVDYVHKVLHWPTMRYRDQKKLHEILTESGFKKITFYKCGTFTTWIAEK